LQHKQLNKLKEETNMARSKWLLSGIGTFIIPVKTAVISKENEPSFAEFHNVEGCGARLGRLTNCKGCGKVVPSEEKGKGWIFTAKQEKPLQFTKDEIASLHPNDIPEGTIQVVNFIEALPFKYYNGSHKTVAPQEKNAAIVSALALFYEGLHKTKRVALVRYWDNNTSYFAVLNSQGVMSNIYFSDEVADEKENETLALVSAAVVAPAHVTMMEKIIKANTKPFDIKTALHNTFLENVTARAIEKQEKGVLTVSTTVATPTVNVQDDLMAALTASIALAGVADEEPAQATGTADAKPKAKKAKK
jgi:non-homologous end joining protein Ku